MNARQQRFVEEYLVDLNASAAARRAGYSHKTAAVQAFDLLRNPKIIDALAAKRAEVSERVAITTDMVLGDILRIGKKAESAAEYNAALRARELLGKHLGLFTERVQLTGKDGESLSLKVAFETPKTDG